MPSDIGASPFSGLAWGVQARRRRQKEARVTAEVQLETAAEERTASRPRLAALMKLEAALLRPITVLHK